MDAKEHTSLQHVRGRVSQYLILVLRGCPCLCGIPGIALLSIL